MRRRRNFQYVIVVEADARISFSGTVKEASGLLGLPLAEHLNFWGRGVISRNGKVFLRSHLRP